MIFDYLIQMHLIFIYYITCCVYVYSFHIFPQSTFQTFILPRKFPKNMIFINFLSRIHENEIDSSLQQLKLAFNCDEIDSDELSEVISELGVLSCSVEVASEKKGILNDEANWYDLQKTKSWQTAILKAHFPSSFDISGVISLINEIYPDNQFQFDISMVANIDWISEVQKGWKPCIIDDLTINLPWHESNECTTKHLLTLEGGAAFGTGDHPTTRLCCRWLSKVLRESKESQEMSVLDYGTGSGILGLTALKYGAKLAVGVDIDKDALASARRNCENNQLSMDVFMTSDRDGSTASEERSISLNLLRGKEVDDFMDESHISNQQFNIVIANILAPILINLESVLASRCQVDGFIAMSGVVRPQAQAVIDAYRQHFDDLCINADEDDWVIIVGKRNKEK